MTAPATSNPYNYYPTTSIELCVISYSSADDICGMVTANTDLEVVWGPAEVSDPIGIPFNLMYVAKNASTDEYFVVIRGTTPESITSWLEDFEVSTTQPFSALPGAPANIPADALISTGTFDGMTDLIKLVDPTTGQALIEFLQGASPRNIYVTGHSLGGTLTSPMFTYINALLNGGNPTSNMALWGFAGLTPGGAGFNSYFNSIVPNDQGFLWRIQNSLDIAPFLYDSEADIENVYAPNGLAWGDVDKTLFDYLFGEAQKAGITYAQAQPGEVIPGVFDQSIEDEYIWAAQAAHQHHSTTYRMLVDSAYPT